MSETASRFETRNPTLLCGRALIILNSYGLLLMIPALAAIATVSVIRLSWWSVIIPVAAALLSLLLLPLGFGNWSITRWLRPIREQCGQPSFVVQVRFRDYQHRAVGRALLEDADDIGVLCLENSAVRYKGDAFSFHIPATNLEAVRCGNIGWRGFFIYGGRCVLTVNGIPELREIEIAERQSLVLPQSWIISRRISKMLKALRA